MKTQDVQNRLRDFGLTPTGTSAEYLAKELAADYDYWGKIVSSSTSRSNRFVL